MRQRTSTTVVVVTVSVQPRFDSPPELFVYAPVRGYAENSLLGDVSDQGVQPAVLRIVFRNLFRGNGLQEFFREFLDRFEKGMLLGVVGNSGDVYDEMLDFREF